MGDVIRYYVMIGKSIDQVIFDPLWTTGQSKPFFLCKQGLITGRLFYFGLQGKIPKEKKDAISRQTDLLLGSGFLSNSSIHAILNLSGFKILNPFKSFDFLKSIKTTMSKYYCDLHTIFIIKPPLFVHVCIKTYALVKKVRIVFCKNENAALILINNNNYHNSYNRFAFLGYEYQGYGTGRFTA